MITFDEKREAIQGFLVNKKISIVLKLRLLEQMENDLRKSKNRNPDLSNTINEVLKTISSFKTLNTKEINNIIDVYMTENIVSPESVSQIYRRVRNLQKNLVSETIKLFKIDLNKIINSNKRIHRQLTGS